MLYLITKLKNKSRQDYINYLIFLFAFCISFPIEIIRPITLLMIVLWITDRTSYPKLPKVKLFLLFGIFIFFCILSYTWSDVSVKEASYYIRRYWYFFPAFIIFKYLKKENFDIAISLFLSGIFMSEVLSYGNLFGLWEVGIGSMSNPRVFMHHSIYGIFLSIVSLFLVFKLLIEEKNKFWFINLFFFISITINIFVNSGRTGYFVFALSLITILFIKNIKNIKNMTKQLTISIAFVIVIVLLAFNLSNNFKNRIQLIETDILKILDNNYNTSIGARIGFWIITKEILINDPFLGSGIANHNNLKNEIVNKKYQNSKKYLKSLVHFHNMHLEYLSMYGIIGYLLFLSILINILYIKIKDPVINDLKTILVVVYMYGSLTDMLFYLSHTMVLFSLILGLILVRYRIENTKTSNYLNLKK
mgnify:CR=1 FL=1